MTEDLFRTDSYLATCTATVIAAGPEGIRLDRTVFYPMGGGQPGDTGRLTLEDGGAVVITDTRKDPETGDIVHVPEADATLPAVGATVTAAIDWDRRHRLMRMHTLLHLLSSLVAGGVTGGSVGDGKGRLDFDLPDKTVDKESLTAALNDLIARDAPLSMQWITDAEMEAQPDLVRTMSVKPPMGTGRVRLVAIEGVDLQPCGGTHVARTGEIGPVTVTKIEKKGKHNRRINLALAEPA
ncbi:alanyl-tRNA editing protein [Roseospira marina]|uniref:Alanine--tRNA ligase n=1 Tax=Roseospira marina TaxID=140057 RepID=A0A5M6I7Q0_9PROT|nr:alanyl-tRNA editing protein [Roseospira marina]KAA5603865.1 alanyl-tRNA editing protein [Roseospira marina]MBB4313729.1 misacylated tRNA(Ala) deacylase [Roseospira marina]MBB5086891.1 misacylated tRNA(Ala) deacylase [Roseospira marina]